MKKHIFDSTVYHLFHGHETKRDDTRFPIFNRHKKYKQEDWYEHIRRNSGWGMPESDNIDMTDYKSYLNESLLYVYTNSRKPRITICMVSYLRYETLIKSLNNILSLGVSVNLLLWINQSDKMTKNIRDRVRVLCSKFPNHEITFSKTNMGTGYPRFMMLNKAHHEYDTEFVMTTDDDIMFRTPEELVLGATVLDQKEYSDYGAIGIWCDPRYNRVHIKKGGKSFSLISPTEGFYDVDALGAATMTIRRSVLKNCNCDPQYLIGLVDWDFSMSMRQEGWKLGLVCDNRYKPLNDVSGSTNEYRRGRWDETVIENSKKLFRKKWNIKIR
ncbi:MAG: hypothetical protein KAS32_09220 [Candidatus Peribacteraceae bacterium]|nr:hypothetical protein [Candidatus Peribacteraceae bacterium]